MVQNGHGTGGACVKLHVHEKTDTTQQYNLPFGTIWLIDFHKKNEQRAVSVNPKGKKRSSGLVRGPSDPIFCEIRPGTQKANCWKWGQISPESR